MFERLAARSERPTLAASAARQLERMLRLEHGVVGPETPIAEEEKP